MTAASKERLYQLLPAIYRTRDAALGEPLRAFLAVAEAEAQRIEADLTGLYNNWFIETCEDWAVPYLADLLGIRMLPAIGGPGFNQRTHVANTLSYRRRKGTSSLLGDLARDVTGWPVRLVEMFRLTGQTQHLMVPQPANLRTPDLRNLYALARLGTPFDTVARTADVRLISEGETVRHSLSNVAMFVCRIQAYRIADAPAGVVDQARGQYTFSALGNDTPLYNPLAADGGQRGEEPDLPLPLRPAALDEDLEALRQALAEGRPPLVSPYFGAQPVFQITIQEQGAAAQTVPPAAILIADLERFTTPPATRRYRVQNSTRDLPIQAAVDPVRGRLVFVSPPPATATVRVSYTYGFSGEVGAGPYVRVERTQALPTLSSRELSPALAGLSGAGLELPDNQSYLLASDVALPAQALTLRAADQKLPVVRVDGGQRTLTLGQQPVVLDGLLFQGGALTIAVPSGTRASLTLRRCTLVPGQVALRVTGGGALQLAIERCIVGDLAVRPGMLTIRDSIVDGTITTDTLTIERATVRGEVTVDTLQLATDVIFLRAVHVRFAQRGCVRYSFVPDTGSITPPRFRCQPDLAMGAAPTEDPARIRARVQPIFTATRLGDPGYFQLRLDCDEQIRRGGSDSGEMGAFQMLHTRQREDNLRAGLDEYIRLGYAAGIFFLT